MASLYPGTLSPSIGQQRDIDLVSIGMEHADDIQRMAADPLIAQFTRIPHPYPPDGAMNFINDSRTGCETGRKYNFAIMAKNVSPSNFIGCCGFYYHGEDRSTAEIGYWIGREYWGNGYATAAAKSLLRFGFQQHDLKVIVADCIERNAASLRVLEKCGMLPKGRRRNIEPKWDKSDFILTFEIRRIEWQVLTEHAR